MPLLRDEGIVLRTQKLGEADRIITVLTRDRGRVRAAARGVRRTTSKFGARLEPFAHIDVQVYTGRTLDNVTQVEILSAYGADLAADYARWTAGQAMLEASERLTGEEGEPAVQQYLLLHSGLRSLVAAEHDPSLILDAFLLRSLAISGWAPSFDECAACSTPGPHRAFHIAHGGALCDDCRVPGAATPGVETLQLMGALLSGDWASADDSPPGARSRCSGLVSAYVQWHLERGLRSLRHVER